MIKKCRTCGKSKALTNINFRESSRKRDGRVTWFFRPTCRTCEAAVTREKYMQQTGTHIGELHRKKCTRCSEKREKQEFRPKLHSNELHPWCDGCRKEFESKGMA